MGGEDGVSAHAHIQCAVARLVESMRFVAMGGVDSHAVAAVLQSQRDVDDQPFSTSDAKIRVDDDHIGGRETRHGGFGCESGENNNGQA